MPVEVLQGFEQAFDCNILEGYGLSETSPVASFNHPDRERKPGSIGTPIEGVEMKVVDDDGNEVAQGEVGEIVIRGHNVMKGYWGRPDATAEAIDATAGSTPATWRTVDEDGYFFIVDRKKDMIIRGGYNVYPREIEEVLYEHPAVARGGGRRRARTTELGEEVGAAVVAQGRAPRRRRGASRAFVKERVAAYKYPRNDLVLRRAPQGPDGQDPQARDRGAGEGDQLTGEAAAVFAGGMLGALVRLGVVEALPTTPGRWPCATFLVNIAGAFLLGVLVGATADREALRLLGTGLLGGYTTFSTWMLDSRRLRPALLLANVGGSLVLGVRAVWIGRARDDPQFVRWAVEASGAARRVGGSWFPPSSPPPPASWPCTTRSARRRATWWRSARTGRRSSRPRPRSRPSRPSWPRCRRRSCPGSRPTSGPRPSCPSAT